MGGFVDVTIVRASVWCARLRTQFVFAIAIGSAKRCQMHGGQHLIRRVSHRSANQVRHLFVARENTRKSIATQTKTTIGIAKTTTTTTISTKIQFSTATKIFCLVELILAYK